MSDSGKPGSNTNTPNEGKTFCVDGKRCSPAWYYRVRAKRRLQEELHNNESTQEANLHCQRLEELSKVQKVIQVAEVVHENTNEWLKETLVNLTDITASSLATDDSTAPGPSSANNSFFCESNVTHSVLEPEVEPWTDEQNVTFECEMISEPTTADLTITPTNFGRELKPEDEVMRALVRLYGIFAKGKTTLVIQRLLLEFMRGLTPEIIQSLPLDGRTLRPPNIQYIRRELPPGEFVYFGIEQILALPAVELFDKQLNDVKLSLSIDGVPVFRQTNGIGFWPISASVDEYSPFLVALYSGVDKPECPNCYLRELVAEINTLCSQGLHVDGRTYTFRLWNMIMDCPARAYILGIKGAAGYNCCQKCKSEGESVQLPGVGKNGKPISGVRHVDLNAPMREHQDYVDYYMLNPDPHTQLTSAAIQIPAHDDQSLHEGIDSVEEKKKKKKKKLSVHEKKKTHHLHPTVITTIRNFNIIFGVPLDYMHLICLGIMKLLFARWSKFKQTSYNKSLIDKRLENARKYCPIEFQRKPQKLSKLCDWKATQFRMFLLYIGVVVLHGALEKKYLRHFYVIVIAIRSMCRRIDRTSKRQEILDSVASICSTLLKFFVTSAVILYSKTFIVYNVHSLIHLADDYRRFGPLDSFSAFKYESFLGRVKSLVTAAFQPVMQVINKYPSLLLNIGDRGTNYIEEFYEIPELRLLERKEEKKGSNDQNEQYSYFREMRFKNFTLRSDREADRHVLMGTDSYVRIERIFKDKYSDDIYITGRIYSQKRSLFSISEPCSFSSQDVGIHVCAELSSQVHTYRLDQVYEKCFALPLYLESKDSKEWVLTRFLH